MPSAPLKRRSAAVAPPPAEAPSSAPRTTLPRIQLPVFTGRYEDWPAFRELFESLIGKDTATKPVEKLHYLKSCVKGEADLLIRNLTTMAENYGRAWTTLSAYYENRRLLVRAYLSNFLALQKMKGESAVELRKLFHGVKSTVSSLESIRRPVNAHEDLFVHLAVDPRSRREWESTISDSTEPPTYASLELFLDRRLHTLEAILPAKVDVAAGKTSSGNGSTKSTRSHHARKPETKSDQARGRCSLCRADHFVMFCEKYKEKTASDRRQYILENNQCVNCLGRHKVSECASKKSCSACGERHHTSLHDAFREAEAAQTTFVTQRSPATQVVVLLATARVRVVDNHGTWHLARALIDQGSEFSIISERLGQRLRLPRSAAAVTIFGVGGKKTGTPRDRVTFTIQPRNGGVSTIVDALILPKLTAYAGRLSDGARSWPHLQGLDLADPDFGVADPIDILLGAEVYATILGQGLRKGNSREPVAQQMSLGWILSGVVSERVTRPHVTSLQCQAIEELATLVRRFWESEELPPATRPLSRGERECEEHFSRTHSRTPDGRYVVRLPTIEPLPDLSGTRETAIRVLKSMERRFERDATLRTMYVDFMQQYKKLEHMVLDVLAPQGTSNRVCHLPHHGVLREASASTKLRVVFNGSSALPSGDHLNKYLQIGPNLLPCLGDTLLRWRQHRYVFATDIEKMYRQILVHPEGRSLQTIVWRGRSSEEIRDFRLNTVTYGLSCAPYLAIRTLLQLADDEGQGLPQGAAVLRQDVYMDDILTGAATIPRAQEIQRQLRLICTAGGFPLKKWSANHSALLV